VENRFDDALNALERGDLDEALLAPEDRTTNLKKFESEGCLL
jgi:hypothetical protein